VIEVESAAGQEVTIKIDDSFTQPVCNYSVGFLRFEVHGNIEVAQPAGSGSSVKLGKVYGILTAAHVLKPMCDDEVVGLVRFPSLRSIQAARLQLAHTERLLMWNGNDGDAPDIAFLKIPEIVGRELEALGAVFYNFEVAREFKPSKPEHRMAKCYAVVGVVGEWTEEAVALPGKGQKTDVGALFGAAKLLREFRESDADLVEVEIDYAEGPKIPQSYGGVSGGALWELHVELDKEHKPAKINQRLSGVAFRQSEDNRRITFNAASAVHALKQQIARKWPGT
jgi:hypothetical protein